MNSAQALHQFWSSFGWTAYDENTVPSEEMSPAIPRITYRVAMAEFDETIQLTASLWDKSYSWESISIKCNQIYAAIGYGGIMIPYDNGRIWLKRGVPFSQRMSDEDDSIRRIVLTLEAEYLTAL